MGHLSTLITDTFDKASLLRVAEALEELCSPEDWWGWASAGIYCFWDPATKKPLYIGLAVDLPQRFRQHAGIAKVQPKNCKLGELSAFLNDGRQIGFSILTMTSNLQPKIRKALKQFTEDADKYYDEFSEERDEISTELQLTEGGLLETAKVMWGKLPSWNKIGGSRDGQKLTNEKWEIWLKMLCRQQDGPILARRTIRQLAADPHLCALEVYLHILRFSVVNDMSTNLASAATILAKVDSSSDGRLAEIRAQGYCPFL